MGAACARLVGRRRPRRDRRPRRRSARPTLRPASARPSVTGDVTDSAFCDHAVGETLDRHGRARRARQRGRHDRARRRARTPTTSSGIASSWCQRQRHLLHVPRRGARDEARRRGRDRQLRLDLGWPRRSGARCVLRREGRRAQPDARAGDGPRARRHPRQRGVPGRGQHADVAVRAAGGRSPTTARGDCRATRSRWAGSPIPTRSPESSCFLASDAASYMTGAIVPASTPATAR